MMDEAVSSPSFRPNRVFGSPTVKPVGIATLILGLIIAGSRLLAFAHAQTETGKWQTPLPVIVLGTIIGMTYGLLAVGLVLIYRSNRIINFAHGQIGAFGAAFFGIAVVRWHLPYWVGVPIALALAGGVGAAAETGVVRRLRKAPRLMSVVATLGVGQFLLLFAAALNGQAGLGARYPEPSFVPTFTIGKLHVGTAYSSMLLLSPLIVLGLALFLRYSRFGLGVRLAASNPDAARMSGISASRMSSLAWALAGALSAFTAILTQPTLGFTTSQTFGPKLLLLALAGAVIARMQSLPVALVAGIAIGIIQQLLLWNYPQAGLVEVSLFVIIIVALLLQRQRGGRDEEKGSWAAVQALRPLPDELRGVWSIRHLGAFVGILALGFAVALPLMMTSSSSITMTGIFGFMIVGISVGIVTGLGGQLTLGQFALAGIGATISAFVVRHHGGYALAFVYAGLGAGIVSVLIGLPALRIRGLLLTVTTLSFALVVPGWLLGQPWMLNEGKLPGRPVIFGVSLSTGKSYYYFGLAILLIAFVLARNVRRSGFGRLLVAIRDNEDAARAFTVRASVVKLQAYILGGFLAGVGGAMYGHALSRISARSFPTQASIDIVVMTVIGGVSLLAGPLLGALLVIAVPAFVPLDSAGLAATALGQLLIVLYLPRGLSQLAEPVRDRVARFIGRRAGVDIEKAYATDSSGAVGHALVFASEPASPQHYRPAASAKPLLSATDLRKSFGGVHAVAGVSLEVLPGETVGLIGPNGAGKTTTFELLGGFTKADSGGVVFDEYDVSRLGPEDRARLGLIRSFQDAVLFPTMTVIETVQLSLERVSPTPFLRSTIGLMGSERHKDRQARELVSAMGLDPYRRKQIQELSTGTRRIVELACLVGLRPKLLLLDEPSSGIAQRETEALGQLLQQLRNKLDVTLLIIEHDIPLVMGISDRIVAMADGRIISEGTPDIVRNDPRVVDAYLGRSVTAIERSGLVVSDVPSILAPAQENGQGDLRRLSTVRGLGSVRAAALLERFGSTESIRAATLQQLQEVGGVGPSLARRVVEALNTKEWDAPASGDTDA